MTDAVFDLLRTAVTLAREQRIQQVATLRAALVHRFPGQEQDVDAALRVWAQHDMTR